MDAAGTLQQREGSCDTFQAQIRIHSTPFITAHYTQKDQHMAVGPYSPVRATITAYNPYQYFNNPMRQPF